jgi:hypothetical protein
MQEMTDQMWAITHRLAADLALNQVSKNLVQQAADHLRRMPQASLTDYLDRLERLGDYFSAGKSGQLERSDLRRVLERVEWSRDAQKALAVLGWTARLVEYYTHRSQEAMEQCGLRFLLLRPGDHLDGVVRERRGGTVWVAVAPGQWGRATRRHNVEIGDQVQVAVQRVTNPIQFDVEIVSVTRPAASEPSQSERLPEPPAPPISDEVSDEAKEIYAFLQEHWGKQEDKDAE